jgi:chemotaxis protein MotB
MSSRLRRRSNQESLNPWPGYVDALSTLLMVIIFVLLVFVLAQAFLSVVLSGRNQALDRLNRQVSELSDMLSLERGHSADLRSALAQMNSELRSAAAAREALAQQLNTVRGAAEQAEAARDAAQTARDKLAAQLADAQAQAQAQASRTQQLQSQLTDAAKAGAAASTAMTLQLAAAQQALADARAQLAQMRAQMAALDQTVHADKATIEARLSDLARLSQQVQALSALRDQLERQAQDAAVRATSEAERRAAVAAQLADEQKLAESAKAQMALLSQQVSELRAQLQQVSAALGLAQQAGTQKDQQIADLGQRLNTALAAKVEELQRYRSEFFGRLRAVLAGQPGVQIVGDRFVFQSEVLFPVGSADLTESGQAQMLALATTLQQIAKDIPPDIHWILRVDGHADKQKINGGAFASNWELSAQRAINVVKLLTQDGIPADHLAATAFGDNQPLANGDTSADYARNRRIELRLTER